MRTWRWGVLFTGACFFLPHVVQAEDGLFERLDKNKDGQLASDEIESSDKGLFERLLRNHDKNTDGKLSREEFTAGTTNQPKEAGAPAPGGPGREGAPEFLKLNPAEIFKRLDKNNDGKVSKDEAGDRIKEHFDQIDANKDGNIDAAEFTKAHEELAKRFAGAAAPGGRPGPQMAEELFKKVDKNSDGKITKDEIEGDGKERLERLMQRIGGDSVTKEQFIKAISEQREREGGEKKPESSSSTANPARPGAPGGEFRSMVSMPVLKALDANGDGEVSAEELANASKALAALDKNGDGKLTREELLPAGGPGGPGGPGGNPGEYLKAMLQRADKNGDGKISKEEAPPFLAERFGQVDTNGDGQLDEAEMKQVGERMKERLGNAGERLKERRPSDK